MKAVQVLKLNAHNGKLMTRPEILLDQFHERRHAEQKMLADEKVREKLMLSRISSKLITVPSLRKDLGDGSVFESKAEMLIKEIERESQPSQFEEPEEEEEESEAEEEIEEEDLTVKQKTKRNKSDSSDNVEEDSQKKTGEEENVPPSGVSKRIKKKQRQEDIITSASEQDLTAIFSPAGLVLSSDWNTIKDPVMRDFKLENFGYEKNNTLALKLTAPPNSTRWSFNICPPDHFESTNILLHFNPRKGKRTELVMNDKQGTWGQAIKKSLASLSYSSSTGGGDPGLLGTSIELVVHVKEEGFFIFVNRHFCVFFPHRRDPEYYSTLRLTLPVLDDNGNEEHAVYHRVWWGVTDPSLPYSEIPASVLALAATEINPAGLRTVLVSGLPQLHDVLALQVLEGALLNLFEEYAPEAVNVVPGDSGTAYVKLTDRSYVDEFIETFNGSTVGEDGQKQFTLILTRYDAAQV